MELSKPGSHSQIGWNNFICDVIKLINNKRNVVFILWGQHAKTYSKFITNKDHLILF